MAAKRILRKAATSNEIPIEEDINPSFKVVMVFEDFATGVRAKATMDRVLETLEAHFPFEIKFWRFDLLELEQFRELAATEAADADMVIVSAHGGPQIPDGFKSWLELWLNRHLSRECALVELLDSQGEGSRPWPIDSLLRIVARKAHLEFFSHNVGPRVEEAMLEPYWDVWEAVSRNPG